MASFQSASTQPFSDASEEEQNPETIVTTLQPGEETAFTRILVRSLGSKHTLRAFSVPDSTSATKLNADVLAFSQTSQSLACDITVPAVGEASQVHIRLFFNPNSDGAIVRNELRASAVKVNSVKSRLT